MTRLIAVVGPSGAGKDLLMARACALQPGLCAARRVITRPSSAGGEDFEGVDEAEFARRITEGAFALHWRAHGLGYGIPKAELSGREAVLFNASRMVLEQACAMFPDLVIVNVTAPAEVLAARLAARGREASADQGARLARASLALPAHLRVREVMNDATPEIGVARFLAALQPERV